MTACLQKVFNLSCLFFAITLAGCASQLQGYYTATDYKSESNRDYALAPLLLQYKFLNPVQEHEVLIVDKSKKNFLVRIREDRVPGEGYIVNLPAGRVYSIASIYILIGLTKKELRLSPGLQSFKLSKGKLTRIRGFDILNETDPRSDKISIAQWDDMTDNLLAVQALKKFQVDEKDIITVEIFKNPNSGATD